ncbi:LysE family translocator [Marinibacterium profundimaris]|uniref:Amino acid transporter LysE n=1 Tax=Marinibacterium profundimaris TaxID=1679460 RepID=A0A225NRE4_9RHOB|nr:LysE family translocator [Marinibacterium profundimaris]OWU77432.1 amino acid transporter LysE [Marinibacterium profundimaris]
MFEFALAVLFLIITPGPGVLSAAGVGSGFGYRAGLAYVGGLFVGNALVSGLVISGVAAVVLAVPGLRGVLVFASTAYLLYLALKIALAGSKIAFIHADRAPGFWNGLALQPINPKAYVVSSTLFFGFPFLPQAPGTEVLVKLLIFNALWIPIHLAWLWAGVTLRRLELDPGIQRGINIAMALAMLMVVGLALYAQLSGPLTAPAEP